MNEQIIEKLDEITLLIEKNEVIRDYVFFKGKVDNNYSLLDSISKLKKLDNYSNEYLEIKKNILNDSNYKNLKENEKKIYFLVQEINSRLKKLL